MWNGRRVSVVFPAYNEGPNVTHAVKDFAACGWGDEVIVVDNNSTDDTARQEQHQDDGQQPELLAHPHEHPQFAGEARLRHRSLSELTLQVGAAVLRAIVASSGTFSRTNVRRNHSA